MISEKNYDISFNPSKVFMSDNPIRSKLYCRVFIDKIGEGTWEVVNENVYDVINDSIVFSEFPIGKFLSIQVSTTPAELMQSPTENTIIVSIKKEIKEVSNVTNEVIVVSDNITTVSNVSNSITNVNLVGNNILDVNNVGNNIAKVQTVADNIVKVNTVADNIVNVGNVSDSITNVNLVGNNILDVNTVGNNIIKVQTVSDNISNVGIVAGNITNVNNAEENANIALSSKNLAEKWASELENVPVTDGKYSAYHWALKAYNLVSAGILDDTIPSSIKTYSSNKIEAVIDSLTLADIDETVTLKHFTDVLLSKLNNIEEMANNYTHPATHSASMIEESMSKLFVSETEKIYWHNKQEALVSGTNIKTINSSTVLGSGNLSLVDTANNQSISGTKTFTISPTAPTPTVQDNSTKVATTAYVDGKMVLGTAIDTASGTAFDFTNIPSWVKRITLIFNDMSLTGADDYLIQLGTSGGIVTTGYKSTSVTPLAGQATAGSNSTSGINITSGQGTNSEKGTMTLNKFENNTWIGTHISYSGGVAGTRVGCGRIVLPDTLTTLRLTRSGTNSFDSGKINIMYEG